MSKAGLCISVAVSVRNVYILLQQEDKGRYMCICDTCVYTMLAKCASAKVGLHIHHRQPNYQYLHAANPTEVFEKLFWTSVNNTGFIALYYPQVKSFISPNS